MGDAPKRREDVRFLKGQGTFLDDLAFKGLGHAAFLRSPHAHARIDAVDVSSAHAAKGVLAVLTVGDALVDGLAPLYPGTVSHPKTGMPFNFLPQPLLAHGIVRYVGEPIALVVAESLHQALDALELINVEYTILANVTTAEAAQAVDAPQLTSSAPSNLCFEQHLGDAYAVETAMNTAAHLVEMPVSNPRIIINPMEPRGVLGKWNPADSRYTLHVSSQHLHLMRDATAKSLGVESKAVRFVAPDVGGAFGVKNFAYTEFPLIAWAAKRVGRPVKWIATRSEMFLTDHQARDHSARARLAIDTDGRFQALEIRNAVNLGAYMVGSSGAVQATLFTNLAGTIYDIPAISVQTSAVYSNTTPLGVTRAPGYSEASFIMERLIDTAARQCGFDAADLRRRNFFKTEAMPVTSALGESIDSGDFSACLDAVLVEAQFATFGARRTQSEEDGRLRGFGHACHIKATGGVPYENVEIRFEEDDTVTLISGTQSIGQGHETSFPQIISDLLGVPDSSVTLVDNDTDRIERGGGHGSSRSTYMAGTAMYRASEEIIRKGLEFAAGALEADPEDIAFRDGLFSIAGTDRSVGILEVAHIAREAGSPLDTYDHWTREHMTYPNGAHAAEVEIDPETGKVELISYTIADDYGVIVNPMIVHGQAHGAAAQGIGQALLERVVVDPDSGQPQAASFMDYAMPRADDLPPFDVAFHPTRCTTNPLGVKGAAEAACVGAPSAIVNAVIDALWPLGVRNFSGAATPDKVWRAIQSGKAEGT